MARSREQWRSVLGFEDTLMVSSEGRAARICGFDYGGYRAVSIVPGSGHHDALTADRNPGLEMIVIPIHRMVALAFLGEPADPKMQVNHKDGVKGHNDVSNLEWCTPAENMAHARRTGLIETSLKKYTEEHYAKARELWASGEWKGKIEELAAHLGMTRGGLCYAIYTSKRGRGAAWPAQA